MQTTESPLTSARQHLALAERFGAAGNQPGAEQHLLSAVQLEPGLVEAWVQMGILLRQQGRMADAEACYCTALRLEPENFDTLTNFGNLLFDLGLGRLDDALDLYEKTVILRPDSAEAHHNLARAALLAGLKGADHHFREAVRLQPEFALAWEGLGLSLFGVGDGRESTRCLAKALDLQPDSIESRVYLARGHLLHQEYDEAAAQFSQVQQLHPDDPRGDSGLASVRARQGKWASASRHFEAALATGRADSWTGFQHAMLLLMIGDYERGWEAYDKHRAFMNPIVHRVMNREIPGHRWQGEPLAGKRILVTAEQGLGDEIMFASMLPEIAAEAAQCIVECDIRLAPLLRRSLGVETIGVERKSDNWMDALPANLSQLPAFDCWVPEGSLPRYRRRNARDFPQHQGYLRPDPQQVLEWQSRLAQLGSGLRVGITWRGGVLTTNTKLRSLALQDLLPIIGIPGLQLHSLQHGADPAELAGFQGRHGVRIHHWPGVTDDMDACAALVQSLDLVLTVCNYAVHLAGSLGKEAWVMTPHVPEWRYGNSGSGMPWYPSVRLVRQPAAGSWEPVIASIAGDLQARVAAQAAHVSAP
jgi:tetratricopeptide (TPR) repeat protein